MGNNDLLRSVSLNGLELTRPRYGVVASQGLPVSAALRGMVSEIWGRDGGIDPGTNHHLEPLELSLRVFVFSADEHGNEKGTKQVAQNYSLLMARAGHPAGCVITRNDGGFKRSIKGVLYGVSDPTSDAAGLVTQTELKFKCAWSVWESEDTVTLQCDKGENNISAKLNNSTAPVRVKWYIPANVSYLTVTDSLGTALLYDPETPSSEPVVINDYANPHVGVYRALWADPNGEYTFTIDGIGDETSVKMEVTPAWR